jgi:hypothetical protein
MGTLIKIMGGLIVVAIVYYIYISKQPAAPAAVTSPAQPPNIFPPLAGLTVAKSMAPASAAMSASANAYFSKLAI